VQAKISAQKLQARVGKTEVVLIDEVIDDVATARSYSDAPEIDGVVHVPVNEYDISAGDFIEVDIVRADAHDLYGHIPD